MTRPVRIDDFANVSLVSDPHVSPDASSVLFCVQTVDRKCNRMENSLWLVPSDGSGCHKRLTATGSSASCGRWSPDGSHVAFISDRKKPGSQIFLLPTDGGEATQLTTLAEEGSISALWWSPTGSHIAFLYRATPEPWREEAIKARKEAFQSSPVRVHTRLNYRSDGLGFVDGEYSQIWVAAADGSSCRRLTDGRFECHSLTWSPDGSRIAYITDRREDSDRLTVSDSICVVGIDGSEPVELPSPPGSKSELTWSPNDKLLAFTGNTDPEDNWGTRNTRVIIIPSTGSTEWLDLTGRFDLEVGYHTLGDCHMTGGGQVLQWLQEGESILFPVSIFGSVRLFSCTTDGEGEPLPISDPHSELGGYHAAPGGSLVAYTHGNDVTPLELYSMRLPLTDSPQQISNMNRDFLAEVCPIKPEAVEIGRNGGAVHGWILRPANFTVNGSWPLVLYVHGGPHTQYGHTFFHELQFLAASGFVVLYTNPRGSKGYGEAHTRAIHRAWGTVDWEDIQLAADYGASLPGVDASRMAIMGGSYGGYMTAWAVGHTQRFACAIADRLVAANVSMAGTTDFAWRHGLNFEGNSWDNTQPLQACSPLSFAAAVTTPLLLIHSDGDLRCPIGQAEEMFAALRHMGKKVEFVRYPAETSHGMSRNGPPDLRIDRLQRNVDWLNRWLQKQ